MSHSGLAPIALFAYNRPDHLTRVADALARSSEAPLSRLFVFSDAPKNAAAQAHVAAVRSSIRSITGFQSVEVIEQSTNRGVARSIIDGVSDLTTRFGKVIVLEDDLLPSQHFLRYMNDALNLYGDAEEVISIHGYSYPVSGALPETFFLRGADCWGWATWKRGWDLFEADGSKLLRELTGQGMGNDFDFDGSYAFVRLLQDCVDGKNDSWAIRWYASAFLKNKLTLYPGSSLVQNIGADGSGVHVGATTVFHHLNWGRPVRLDYIPVEESMEARECFVEYFESIKPSPTQRVWSYLGRLGKRAGLF